ncbi:MAG: hypothetical protein AAF984_03390 [Verrucomicrobiota bacterium]
MSTDTNCIHLANGFISWSAYSQACKTILYSHAFAHKKQVVLIDPIELTPEIESELLKLGQPTVIMLTNANHERASLDLRSKYNIPLAASVHAVKELIRKPEVICEDVSQIHELTPISIYGAAPGETAFYHAQTRTMIVGDALINLDETGFDLLPEKYCENQIDMRKSLTKLLDYPFETLLVAHGDPLTNDAFNQLKSLLAA